ncbi:hypothetical protein [Oceaniserpentilla sp. 4NH20-0058]|uniref:hypothetical protein n=1 Tax=Oceaniserpentilla sp. 4NH20-0058 TaxID=3127660 RepID=UPI00334250B8
MDVFLKNRGDNDGEYRVSLRNQRMGTDGKFEIIEKGQGLENELFADGMIRYSPRRVSISKDLNQEPQTIRLALRKKRDLPEGEYRSHLLFTSIPQIEKATEKKSGVSFHATVEITIPIIIRHGDLSAKVTLSNASLWKNDKEDVLSFRLNRSGSRSIYGDIVITQNGNRIAYLNGMAVYTPTEYREIHMPVILNDAISSSPITINFKENPTYGGQEEAQLLLK